MLTHTHLGATLAPVTTARKASVTTAVSGSVCPQCGTNKLSGKASCCAPDGAWFELCGEGDAFKHTFAEGLRACKGRLRPKLYSCLQSLANIFQFESNGSELVQPIKYPKNTNKIV